MNDEQAAVYELEEARARHRARQSGRDALAMISAAVANDTDAAEQVALTTDTPRAVAYAAGCYAAGILQAFSALADDAGSGPCDRPSTCPQLRACENGGSYAAGSNPRFYGAYQFADSSTRGMTPAQQDAHADAMYAERGAQPWPTCGKYLR